MIFDKLAKASFLRKAKQTSERAHGEIVARLIVDTDRNDVLFVPAGTKHPEFAAARLGKTVDDLKRNPDLLSPFVGVAVRIVNDQAEEVLVGISGIEMYFVRYKSPLHTKAQVIKARDLVIAMLQAGKMLSEHMKVNLVFK